MTYIYIALKKSKSIKNLSIKSKPVWRDHRR